MRKMCTALVSLLGLAPFAILLMVSACGTTRDPLLLFPDSPDEDAGGTMIVARGHCDQAGCGATCEKKCDNGATCATVGDCTSNECSEGKCTAPATCSDARMNGDESDVDCGGSCPNRCADGSSCNAAADCVTVHCEAHLCDAVSCADHAKNGDETDTDCGGHCRKCSAGARCDAASDCSSNVCKNNVCEASSCSDGVKNGAETDTDCGGTCSACAVGKGCKAARDCDGTICLGVCVECLKGTDCASRICTSNACVSPSATPPSCQGLPATCGLDGKGDCCASDTVSGGTFNRSFDGALYNDTASMRPATLSTFRLDRYETTVGRFRKFVAGYPGNRPAPASGANPSNPADQGWDKSWTPNLPASAALLTSSFTTACPAGATWTDVPGANEMKPINCLTWYAAYAFCIWDEARLPTEAEWNYAAAGGGGSSGQRIYPWSNGSPLAPADAWYGQTTYNDVGKLPAGASRFGQLDMAGNVWEWTLDYYAAAYPMPCTDCANLTTAPQRTIRGGIQNPGTEPTSVMMNGNRGSVDPANQSFDDGVRCARK